MVEGYAALFCQNYARSSWGAGQTPIHRATEHLALECEVCSSPGFPMPSSDDAVSVMPSHPAALPGLPCRCPFVLSLGNTLTREELWACCSLSSSHKSLTELSVS
ncbi:multifunctional protein ADE2 [Platysternon megacephalum]|uniref:Multifunctional protein ADE2 n=1 Tax=Platysternon megacephalum TaxID=55544 RepID=A0A4D9F701_9SAUR|nr:multifunctional protein ADE2 [Platysternon megacephalum]